MRASRPLQALAVLALLAGCDAPLPEAYIPASIAAVGATGEPAGQNARGEECLASPGVVPPTDLPGTRARDIFCGGWTQPAARIVELRGPTDAAQLDAIANGGLWRTYLDQRFACAAPRATTLAGGRAARLLACTRRNGGWAHLALVAAGSDGPVLADGLPATLPVIEREIAGQAPNAPLARSAALDRELARLTSGPFGAADVGRYEQLMAVGRELNQAENYTAAEEAYRAALAIQERLLGPNDPNTAAPLMHLALNLSNEGRRAQAQPLFARAETLAPRAADPLASARLLHYRGLDALNAGDPARAATLLERAERGYAAYAPMAAAQPQDDVVGAEVADPLAQSALLGVAEARRNRGVALARSGHPAEGAALANDAREMLRKAGLEPNLIVGRSLRTVAGSTGALGQQDEAARLFGDSARRFGLGAPGERPEAATLFLAGSRALQAGHAGTALGEFRSGAQVLRTRQIALPIPLVLPYLDALWAEAARDPASLPTLSAEMFAASQLAQRGHTSELVAQASARLGAAGGNTRVASAVRRLQDADRALRDLYAERDAAETADAQEFDARITAAQSARADAESEVAAAAPGYRQLLQAAADAPAVAKVLAPTDALVSMLLGRDHGYVFALRADGTAKAARIDTPEAEIAGLVARIRKNIEPGANGSLGAFDTAAASAVYQAVLAPVTPALDGAETLLVSPDGPLLGIPFGLLLTAPASPNALHDAPWLIRRYAVVHIPSPQTMVTLRAGAGASAGSVPYSGFGDPIIPTAAQLARSFPADRCGTDSRLAAQLAPLPGTQRELDAARRLTGAGPDAVHLGAAFSESSLRGAGLDRTRILHLATHALLPGELSCLREPTILVSAPRGAADASAAFMPASALINLKLDADLVILSACNTGTTETGEGSGGEALSGLARAFFFAGARGLLVTHWSVDDQASAITVADTLGREQQGATSAAALRGAQLRLIDQSGQGLPAAYAHPFYWAPFALIGDGKRAAAMQQAANAATMP